MRKVVALLLLCFVLGFGALYLFFPRQFSIREATQFPVNPKALSRVLFEEKTWTDWWPKKQRNNPGSANHFLFDDYDFSILEKKHSSLVVLAKHRNDSLLTELVVIPVSKDSVELNWIATVNASANPLDRLRRKAQVKQVSACLQTLLQCIRSYYADTDHLYDLRIREEKVVDSLLISTAATFPSYPSTENIYGLLDALKRFALNKGAMQSGLPMLNIFQNSDGLYLTRVALPVNKKLKDEGDIRYRWMLGGGNILVAEVKGGPAHIEKAFGIMELYVEENQRTAPAIPFQSLVTDRRNEPDTNKWVTKVFWPVM